MSEHAYIARKPCGCVVAAQVDRPELRESVAESLADWARRGLTVERATVSQVRAERWEHPCEHAEVPA